MNTQRIVLAVMGAMLALGVAGIAVFAEPPRHVPPFELRWSSAVGGGESLSGGPYTAAVSVGQPITGTPAGGSFAAGSGNWSVNEPVRCGDVDGDGDVDLADIAKITLHIGPACPEIEHADCDEDGDIELDDYGAFATGMTGPR